MSNANPNSLATVAMQVKLSSASMPIGQGQIGEGLSEGLIGELVQEQLSTLITVNGWTI